MFRIYCEDVNREKMLEILSKRLQDFTIIPAMGFYNGVREKSVVIEVFNAHKKTIEYTCEDLTLGLHQEIVVFTELSCNVTGTYGTKLASSELELKIALDAPKYYTELLDEA